MHSGWIVRLDQLEIFRGCRSHPYLGEGWERYRLVDGIGICSAWFHPAAQGVPWRQGVDDDAAGKRPRASHRSLPSARAPLGLRGSSRRAPSWGHIHRLRDVAWLARVMNRRPITWPDRIETHPLASAHERGLGVDFNRNLLGRRSCPPSHHQKASARVHRGHRSAQNHFRGANSAGDFSLAGSAVTRLGLSLLGCLAHTSQPKQ
jgi:hypothetical protein